MRFKGAVLERLREKRIKRKVEAIFEYHIEKAKRNMKDPQSCKTK